MFGFLKSLGAVKLVGAFVLLSVLGTLWARGQYYRHQAAEWESKAFQHAFTADSLEATLDTTRVLDSLVITSTGDSLRVTMRRVVQLTQQNGALERNLRVERRAKFNLAAQLASLDTIVEGRAVSNGDSIKASFHVRQRPYTVDASVVVPKDAAPEQESITSFGTIGLDIKLDVLSLGLRVGCSAVAREGLVSSALVYLTTPDWASVSLDSLQQSPEVCNPPLPEMRSGLSPPNIAFGAMLGVAALSILQAVF